MGNKKFKIHFNDYYNYLLSDKGIVPEIHYIDIGTKYLLIKISLSDKIFINLQIDKIKITEEIKMFHTELFSKGEVLPVYYNYQKSDMSNIIPEILNQIVYSIAKKEIYQALKFKLIMIDKIDPFFVNFSINNFNKESISINDIKDTLQEEGMENFKKYLKKLIKKDLIEELDDKLNISLLDCDIIFMKLEDKYFETPVARHICKQY